MGTNSNSNAAYDGHCAFAVSTGKTNVKGGKHSLSVDGKTYLFSNGVAKFLFKVLPKRTEKADLIWNNK
jgi:YHS domain-containing protein